MNVARALISLVIFVTCPVFAVDPAQVDWDGEDKVTSKFTGMAAKTLFDKLDLVAEMGAKKFVSADGQVEIDSTKEGDGEAATYKAEVRIHRMPPASLNYNAVTKLLTYTSTSIPDGDDEGDAPDANTGDAKRLYGLLTLDVFTTSFEEKIKTLKSDDGRVEIQARTGLVLAPEWVVIFYRFKNVEMPPAP